MADSTHNECLTMNPRNMSDLSGILITVLAIGTFVYVPYFLSVKGGWRQLARRYRRTGKIIGVTWWFESAQMGQNGVFYSACMIVTVNKEGIGLAFWPLMRIAHPALFVPWTDILISNEQDLKPTRLSRWIRVSTRSVRLTFRLEPPVYISISAKLANRIQRTLGQAWFQKGAADASNASVPPPAS
jgi:hypothetical protein